MNHFLMKPVVCSRKHDKFCEITQIHGYNNWQSAFFWHSSMKTKCYQLRTVKATKPIEIVLLARLRVFTTKIKHKLGHLTEFSIYGIFRAGVAAKDEQCRQDTPRGTRGRRAGDMRRVEASARHIHQQGDIEADDDQPDDPEHRRPVWTVGIVPHDLS